MGMDSLFVVNWAKVNPNLSGAALEAACWDARVSVEGVEKSASGFSEAMLDYHACWAGVFEQGDYADWEQIESILFREADGSIAEEACLGVLDMRHLNAMIASVEQHRDLVQVGTAEEQIAALTAIRDACKANPDLRAVYQIDF